MPSCCSWPAADAGRKDTGAGSTTAKPKLALIFTPQFKDGSWGEAALTGAQRLKDAGVIADFAAQGYSPIVAHSFNYGDDVKKVAKDFPKIALALVVFARWRPVPCVLGALLFGLCDAAQLRLQGTTTAVPYEVFLALPYLVITVPYVRRRGSAP